MGTGPVSSIFATIRSTLTRSGLELNQGGERHENALQGVGCSPISSSPSFQGFLKNLYIDVGLCEGNQVLGTFSCLQISRHYRKTRQQCARPRYIKTRAASSCPSTAARHHAVLVVHHRGNHVPWGTRVRADCVYSETYGAPSGLRPMVKPYTVQPLYS
ncbi:hypothetical protein GWK47_045200 [Chionoecetes opilio]|uniref:Uncharacterized protein n=1 Tax=Chionoecetes opilio TaxID=41210 RepID=A0A8J4YIJ2_CHIOP|nr:hypothetical protein GWK47_045200 [Chionoecetes opilio]